jgi:hypothetical protein
MNFSGACAVLLLPGNMLAGSHAVPGGPPDPEGPRQGFGGMNFQGFGSKETL